MNAATLLRIYRLIFAALIVVASLQALMSQTHHQAAMLATVEICGAFLFLWRRSQIAGAGLLLLAFAFAWTIEVTHAQCPTHLLQYAASTVFLLLLDTRAVASSRAEPKGV